jgi:hypothetical protein
LLIVPPHNTGHPMPNFFVPQEKSSPRVFLLSIAILGAITLLAPFLIAGQTPTSPTPTSGDIVRSVALGDRNIDTKIYLDQAWELKVRRGLIVNSGLTWDATKRQWSTKTTLPFDAQKAVAHYAGWTAIAARVGINTAETYRELDRIDELAKFYCAFLEVHFTTLGDLRKTNAPEIKQKLLGPELGPDSTRTMAWYWKQSDSSVILRECYLCNADYFYPSARLVRVIAGLKKQERTPAMNRFASDYVPLLVKDHILRPNFAAQMRTDVDPGSPASKKHVMIADEIEDVATAAEMLGAQARDPQLVAIDNADVTKLKDLVKAGVDRFQFSRTLTKDAEGHSSASYFNGDYDSLDDMAYARYEGENLPTPDQKAQAQGASWDISHFSLVPMFLVSLYENRQASGTDFPQKSDIENIGNQYVFHVFEGDFKKPLFKNFFDGSDGWYRVAYSGRSGYGIAPSRFCTMFDQSRGCITVAGIYSWALLAGRDPDIARVEVALIDLARSTDAAIACFQPQCFRERYYNYGETSFSFLDADGNIQYPPALVVVLSEYVLSLSTSSEVRATSTAR